MSMTGAYRVHAARRAQPHAEFNVVNIVGAVCGITRTRAQARGARGRCRMGR
jgi:hypothetical protein